MKTSFTTPIDYTLSCQRMLDECGLDNDTCLENYDWETKRIQATFEAEFFEFENGITGEPVIAALEAAGYRPGTFQENLAVCKAYPVLHASFSLVALGSVVNGRVAFIKKGGCGKALAQGDLTRHWGECSDCEPCRFLAIKK